MQIQTKAAAADHPLSTLNPQPSTSAMHTNETKDRFIELRAKGWGYHRIAEQLNISSSTAQAWAADFRTEIQKLRAVEFEAIQERILASYEQDLTYLAEELKRVQQILRERDYGYVDTQQLYWYQGALMARIDKKCAPIEIPADTENSKSNKIEQNRTLLPGGPAA
jgi:transposase